MDWHARAKTGVRAATAGRIDNERTLDSALLLIETLPEEIHQETYYGSISRYRGGHTDEATGGQNVVTQLSMHRPLHKVSLSMHKVSQTREHQRAMNHIHGFEHP
ncbi:hypothetical protein GNI_056220 [Gregarina niphandrodes]|uniref:Uncharacterized protein n=1 Tax=Gregarina niphandrodes TaxID=110365 RepID=A0A023B8S0_GRENI|nr:hypothetical protein GNI_056220 [Gregarina niphandrodes]EZG70299.1 hypothetical protein GNI_056220 [Gregarina niphandrodes]|eukprot:XP_011129961.1 hypothetical protein GNI_056220 [Gregarina niphandrodes]